MRGTGDGKQPAGLCHFGKWRVHIQQRQSLVSKGMNAKSSSFKAVSGQLRSLPACAVPEEEGGLAQHAGLRTQRPGHLPASSFPNPLPSSLKAGRAALRLPHGGAENSLGHLEDG